MVTPASLTTLPQEVLGCHILSQLSCPDEVFACAEANSVLRDALQDANVIRHLWYRHFPEYVHSEFPVQRLDLGESNESNADYGKRCREEYTYLARCIEHNAKKGNVYSSETLRHCSGKVNCLVVLPGPGGRVAFSSDNAEHAIEVVDVNNNKLLQTLKGHNNPICCLAVRVDGLLASGSSGKTIKLWDVTRGELLQTLRGHARTVCSLTFLSNGWLASGSSDRTVKIWDADQGMLLQTLEGHARRVLCLAALPEDESLAFGPLLASGSFDGSVKIWDVARGVLLKNLEGDRRSPILCLASLPDGSLAFGRRNDRVEIWNVATGALTGALLQVLKKRKGDGFCFTVFPDGRLACGSYTDRTVSIANLAPQGALKSLVGHEANVSCLSILPDGRPISGADDGTIRTWDLIAARPDRIAHEIIEHLKSGDIDFMKSAMVRFRTLPAIRKNNVLVHTNENYFEPLNRIAQLQVEIKQLQVEITALRQDQQEGMGIREKFDAMDAKLKASNQEYCDLANELLRAIERAEEVDNQARFLALSPHSK